MKKILVTGMSGLIGQLVYNDLKNNPNYQLTALNRSKLKEVHCIQADINDLTKVTEALHGIDTVIHLAAQLPGASSVSYTHLTLPVSYTHLTLPTNREV